ncbi:O-methyltransferase [Azospirillum picis]|uniref:O-methyltransferase YrrM n=1 Tax=Azospirillum picis TaxID=488438 RepID=A0ABU0MQJ5_9PROT|nr:class I SAM-dependent methyltransferase [Azospirillum picis]MBP2302174.1 putative O-methyltransferase YrrM [Azospirillum picis]MDQ0535753.1 putative O-methyltransferase YrrM [Azospirillum picis]
MRLEPVVDDLLRELEAHGRENDARVGERAGKMLNLDRETAELLYVLVRSGRRRRMLEIGTSNGVSTLWLAAALAAIGAEEPLTSIERDPVKLDQARANLQRGGLADRVRLVQGDATDIVASLPGPFDCVFFDADRLSAPEQLRLLLPKLEQDCLLLADNALSHPGEIANYIAAAEAIPGVAATLVPVGKGLHVAHRR